jgi:hypothetical protein
MDLLRRTNVEYTTLKVRKDDVKAVREFLAERRRQRAHDKAVKRYLAKAYKFLNANNDRRLAYVKRRPKTEFHWCHIMDQELAMWASLARLVKKDEYIDMCARRGFGPAQRRFLEEGLESIGLKGWTS